MESESRRYDIAMIFAVWYEDEKGHITISAHSTFEAALKDLSECVKVYKKCGISKTEVEE